MIVDVEQGVPGCPGASLPTIKVTGRVALTDGDVVETTTVLHFVNEGTLAGVVYWNGSQIGDYYTRRYVTLTR